MKPEPIPTANEVVPDGLTDDELIAMLREVGTAFALAKRWRARLTREALRRGVGVERIALLLHVSPNWVQRQRNRGSWDRSAS